MSRVGTCVSKMVNNMLLALITSDFLPAEVVSLGRQLPVGVVQGYVELRTDHTNRGRMAGLVIDRNPLSEFEKELATDAQADL